MLMIFPMRPMMLMPPQWLRRDERRQHMRGGMGWAMTQRHLPLLVVAVVTVAVGMDWSKLPEDNSSWSPRKILGRNGPDQSNVDAGRHRMGVGVTWMALQLWKTTRIGSGGTGTTIKSECDATRRRQQQQQQRGRATTTRRTPPLGEKIRKGKEG